MSETANTHTPRISLRKSLADPAFAKWHMSFLFLLGIGMTILFFGLIQSFLLSLFLAAVSAGLAHPVYTRISRLFGNRKGIAAGVTVLLGLCLIIVPLLLFSGILVGEAIGISTSAEKWLEKVVQEQPIDKIPQLQPLLPYQDKIMQKAGQLAEKAGAFVAQILAAGAKGTAEFFLMLFVMLYAAFFFLINGQTILDAVLRFTPLSDDEKHRLLSTFTSVARATLKGTLVIGIVQGGLAGLSFWIAGIKGVIFWSAIMAVLSIIPGIGAPLIWVPVVAYLALSGQVVAAVGVGLWCAIVVGTADNILRPLLVGKDTEMPDLLVLLTTLGGLALFGAVGMVVGPIIGALYITVWTLWSSAADNAVVAASKQTKETMNHDR
jgi:predicted PurR-regulated permease PerM